MERTDVLVDNISGPTPGIVAGDTLQIDVDGTPLDITFVSGTADTSLNQVNTMADLMAVINAFTVSGNRTLEARISETGQLLVQSKDPSATLDITASSANVLGSAGLNFIQDPDSPADYTYEPDFDINGGAVAPYAGQADFPAFANTTTPNTQHWWEMTVLIPDPANPSGSTLTELRKGLINFDGDGSLNAVAGADGSMMIDLTSSPIDFDSSTTGDESSISIDISGMSQFAGAYTVTTATQDGAGVGVRSAILIGRDGTVSAEFTNGQTVGLYKIPLAQFSNVNGLQEESGTVFTPTDYSGDPLLYEAGTQGTGFLSGSTIENSNVELAEEFGNLIVAQRSYSLNSQVISAVNEMTQNLSQLKR
jgi:flagellar hook-basal body protein